ncbi:MAG: phosphatase PAP2 family protein [Prevotella sp.]|nr:phosphatase PAP2 family protein [Prevotella sp.]
MDWDALIQLDKQLLLTLNGSDSLFLDGLTKTLTAAPTWIPLYVALLYLVLKNNDTLVKVLLVLAGAGLCVLIAGTVDDEIVKPWMARWRPTHDGEIGMMVDVVNGYRGGRFGFFSAHASNTFSIAIFFSLLIRSRVLSVSLVAWSLVNCWTRLYLGVHFPGDVACGLLWGALVGTGVWLLHRYAYRRLFEEKVFISKQYTTTGYEHRDVDVVIAVLVFTLVYAILRACFYLYV